MLFGLKNARGTFQRFVNSIFGDLSFVFVYIDDMLVFSSNPNEHIIHLKILFQHLDRCGLTINIEKCKFCVGELNFLGHKISSKGFSMCGIFQNDAASSHNHWFAKRTWLVDILPSIL